MPQTPEDFLASFLQLHQNKANKQELQTTWIHWAKGIPWKDFISLVHFRSLLKQQAGHLLSLIDQAEPQLEAILFKNPWIRSPEELHLQSVREIVLAQRYPEVKPSGDADISYYFESRQKKDLKAAQCCYEKLIDKYPESEWRSHLLRWNRTRSKLFAPLYWLLRNQLADRLLDQIKKTIDFILRCFASYHSSQTWDLLTRLQTAAKIFPADKSNAWKVLYHLKEVSQQLPFRAQEFASVSTLLESYYSNTLFSREEITLILPRLSKSLKISNQRRHVTVKTSKAVQVEFIQKDLKEILINPKITGLENITLSYCWQYWPRTTDSIFENKVYLYSLKHRTMHYKLLQIIKKGQEAKIKDEDILYVVYNVLSRDYPYQYNVRKDLYMQKAWQKIKPVSKEKNFSENIRLLAEERIRHSRERKKDLKLKASQTLWKLRQKKQAIRFKAQEILEKSKAIKTSMRANAEKKLQALRQKATLEKTYIDKKSNTIIVSIPIFLLDPSKINSPINYDDSHQQRISLKDRVQALNLPQEKNVHHLFRSRLEKEIQLFIQSFVERERLHVKAVHQTLAILAVKDFFHNHYDKPYSNWILSNERMKVRELGLDIINVEPIIENCLNNLL